MTDFGLLISQYNATPPTLTDGQYSELQVDSQGKLLVQADVSVIIDFLGLNASSDNSNILVAGTEDGTGTGTPHALRVSSNGSVVIADGGGTITVDATDLDIRDLVYTSDSVAAHVRAGTDGKIITWTNNGASKASFFGQVAGMTTDVHILSNVAGAIANNILLVANGTDTISTMLSTWNVANPSNPAYMNAGDSLQIPTANIQLIGGSDNQDGLDVNVINPIVVTALDLDIRDLDASQDNVAISDGTDTLAINTDGSINVIGEVEVAAAGLEAYNATDNLADGGDGLVAINASGGVYVDLVSISVGAGETAYIYGWQADADVNANMRLITSDGVELKVYKFRANSSAMPGVSEHYSEGGRIEIAGATDLAVKVQAKGRNQAGTGSGSLHARIIS